MRIGVLGAGTMGAGIAQLGAQAGCETLLHDPVADVDAAIARIRERWARKGREHAAPRRADELGGLAGCEVVVEAVPEDLELKRRLFADVADVVGERCVLATNTSSIPVTQIAAGVPASERVVGMHFFNPAPVMPLVEVVAGVESAGWALDRVRALGRAMGKEVVDAADGPGFLVNRCNRPFGLEALELLRERVADVATIDRVVRLGGGFRMGPFELQDLVGLDVTVGVQRSFFELSFGEPRWRPSPLAARMAASGRLGRKAGRGWYEYGGDGPHRPDDEPAPEPGGGDGLVVVAGDVALADELLDAASDAGWDARSPADAAGDVPWLVLDCGAGDDDPPAQGGPRALLLHEGSLATLDGGGGAAGFHALPPFADTRLVELTRGPGTAPVAAERLERLFATLGRHTAWVGDAPGLVLGRMVCQGINEAAFALGEGVARAADVDTGMRLGLSWPRGPLEWSDAIGLDHVACVLASLLDERGDPRYRIAPALRGALATGRSLADWPESRLTA